MSEIKCIIFDWGGVLIDNPTEDFATECSKRIGVNVRDLIKSYSNYADQFERGFLTESELWQKMGERLNIKIPNSNSLWLDCFKKIYSPREEVIELAKKLRNGGYKIALLSNTETPAMNYFYQLQYNFFDNSVFSCAEGYIKPESQIYHILLKKINISANRVLFIDDKKVNIQSAQNIGMKAILFNNFKQLVNELRIAEISV